jgi:Ca2+-binding RTX toxin-like protein
MATVTGATSGVTQIPQQSSGNGLTAQNLLNGISTVNGGSQVSGNSLSLVNPISTSSPVVVGIGGSTPTNVGTIVGSLGANVVAVVINNTAPTTLTTSQYGGNETIVGGYGGLNLTDKSFFSTVNVGGGTNADTMQGAGDSFSGDGNNTIVLNAGNRGSADSVSGTSASSDTIAGTAGSTVGLVYTDGGAGSKALINPTAGNVTIIGNGGAESVYGGNGNAFTGSLTVTNGNGFFVGGTAGNNAIASGTIGGSTLIGGGANDTLTGGGSGDLLVAGASGTETLNGAGGNEILRASLSPQSGPDLMYGSSAGGNEFDLGASTLQSVASTGVIFKGDYISMHISPTGVNLGTLSNTVVISGTVAELGTVLDFISGTDKVVVAPSQGNVTLYYHPNGAGQTVLATASGTTVAFLSKISASDVSGATVVNTVTLSS